jgi:hypothetical protein
MGGIRVPKVINYTLLGALFPDVNDGPIVGPTAGRTINLAKRWSRLPIMIYSTPLRDTLRHVGSCMVITVRASPTWAIFCCSDDHKYIICMFFTEI